jgi:hypothetical protein
MLKRASDKAGLEVCNLASVVLLCIDVSGSEPQIFAC